MRRPGQISQTDSGVGPKVRHQRREIGLQRSPVSLRTKPPTATKWPLRTGNLEAAPAVLRFLEPMIFWQCHRSQETTPTVAKGSTKKTQAIRVTEATLKNGELNERLPCHVIAARQELHAQLWPNCRLSRRKSGKPTSPSPSRSPWTQRGGPS